MPQGLGRSTQTHPHSVGALCHEPEPILCQQGLGRSTQTLPHSVDGL
jgi:hypothetical protein